MPYMENGECAENQAENAGSESAIERYLGSGGDQRNRSSSGSKAIIKKFKQDTFRVVENQSVLQKLKESVENGRAGDYRNRWRRSMICEKQ